MEHVPYRNLTLRTWNMYHIMKKKKRIETINLHLKKSWHVAYNYNHVSYNVGKKIDPAFQTIF